jgi:hypothetical protein
MAMLGRLGARDDGGGIVLTFVMGTKEQCRRPGCGCYFMEIMNTSTVGYRLIFVSHWKFCRCRVMSETGVPMGHGAMPRVSSSDSHIVEQSSRASSAKDECNSTQSGKSVGHSFECSKSALMGHPLLTPLIFFRPSAAVARRIKHH